jgi:hypothetical protein
VNAIAERWRTAFDAQPGLFVSLADGARIGFVARADFGSVAGRRIEGLAHAGERAHGAPMLAFEAHGGAMRVEQARFDGFERASIDLLFVADDDSMAELAREADTFAVAKRALRRGSVMFYALKPKHALQDAGYEDFLDSLGLAFLGACR